MLPGAVQMFPPALPPSGDATPTLGLPTTTLLGSPYPIDSSLKPSRSVLPAYAQRHIFPIGTGRSCQAPAYLVSQRLFHGLKMQSFGRCVSARARYWYPGLTCFFQSLPSLLGGLSKTPPVFPNFLAFFPGLWNLFWLTSGFSLLPH